MVAPNEMKSSAYVGAPSANFAPVRILLEAEEMFPALETRVDQAHFEVLLSFRIFDPHTRLRSAQLLEQGLETWQDLIARTAARGVRFRVLLSDFEPFLTPHLHHSAWQSVGAFMTAFEGAPDAQVLCAQHEAQMSRLAEWVFWPYFLKQLRRIGRSVRSEHYDYRFLPGLFPYLSPRGAITWRAYMSPAAMCPVTHHQKVAIIDRKHAIIGGLDVDERRYDNRHHDRPPSHTWHDLSVEVSGASVLSLRQHFVTWWNAEAVRKPALDRRTQFAKQCPMKPTKITPMPYRDSAVEAVHGPVCIITTRSKPQPGFWVVGPKPNDFQILEKQYELIDNARQLIYIETQFFRHVALAQRLAAAARHSPKLQLILLLPFAPEEVSFQQQDNPAHRHGEFLQIKCLDIVRRAFRDRVGVFGLIKSSKATIAHGRAEAHGSGVVHIHAKVMVVDDQWSIVSSANSNGRSLLWDTEAGIMVDDPAFATELRRRLWYAHSCSDAFSVQKLDTAVAAWQATAEHNAAALPDERYGFIAPFLFQPARSFGARAALVPDNMV